MTTDLDLTYGDKTQLLNQMMIADKYSAEIEEVDLDETFRMKHSPFDRSAIHLMNNNGIIRESDTDFGRVADWEFTEHGKNVIELVETEGMNTMILRDYQFRVYERHADLIEDLPDDTEEYFHASDYDLNGSLLKALREAGFIKRVQKNKGRPDVWAITSRTKKLKEFSFEE